MPIYSFSAPQAPGSEDSFRTAATYDSTLQPLDPSWSRSRDNHQHPAAGLTGRGQACVDLPLVPTQRQHTASPHQSSFQGNISYSHLSTQPTTNSNSFVCTAPASSTALTSRHAAQEPPSRFLMHHTSNTHNSNHSQVQHRQQPAQYSTAPITPAQEAHGDRHSDSHPRTALPEPSKAHDVNPEFPIQSYETSYGHGYRQAYAPTDPSIQASTGVQSAAQMAMPVPAQHVLNARGERPEHRPPAHTTFTPISAESSPILTQSAPACGMDTNAGCSKESFREEDEKSRSDFVFAANDFRAQYGLERRTALCKAWVLQVAVFALLLGAIVAVPHHQRRVKNRENKETSDWVAGDVPGFLAALLLPTLFVLCYLWYLQQCYNTSTAVRIQKLNRKVCVQDYVQQLRSCRPSVLFTATCYHYESKIRYEKGERKHYRLCVVTHQAKKVFHFADVDWRDESPEFTGNEDVLLTSLLLKKDLSLDAAARERFFREFNSFCKKNHFDVFQDYRRVLEIEGFKENQTLFTRSSPPPWWVSATVYWVTAILLVNVPFRMFLDSHTSIVRHRVTKHVAA